MNTETVHALEKLEQSLTTQKDIVEKLRMLHQITQFYVYTDIQKAQHYLEEQRHLFDKIDNQYYYLQYLIQSAVAENHLYNYTFADSVFNKALQIAESQLEPIALVELYIDYIGTCLNLNNFEAANEYILKANKLFERFPSPKLYARLLVREGFYQLLHSNYPKAIELLNQAENALMALPQPLSIKDKFFLSLVFSGLGSIYDKTSENKKATTAYSQVVALCEESGITTRLAWHYLNLGNCYLNDSIIPKAALHFSKAIQCKDDISRQARAAAYANLGYCDFMEEKYDSALNFYDKAEALYNEIAPGELSNFSVIQNWRAKLYVQKGDQVNAMSCFVKASDLARKNDDYKQLAQICKDIAEYHKSLDEFRNAYEYLELYDEFKTRATDEINRRTLMEFEVKYEAERKEKEAEFLRLQTTELQLKALRAQMNPHFMYNALNSIQNFITSYEVTSAAQYLAKFAKLMRQSLDYSELQVISIEKEIEFLEDYLYINKKLRFEDKLEYEIIVDPEIEDDIIGVPTMIVQPYVENAIEHGLRQMKNGKVTIEFKLKDEDTLLCIIQDNGIGREKSSQMQQKGEYGERHQSRGTDITEQRLALLKTPNGEQGGVSIIDLVNDITKEALGTRIEVLIPIQDMFKYARP